jgi:ABC-type multidrug transport system ATPase subunit
MAVLELHSIHKSFRAAFQRARARPEGVTAIEPASCWFPGHNGAGKSTTMKIILTGAA